jgi:hypothetical protein
MKFWTKFWLAKSASDRYLSEHQVMKRIIRLMTAVGVLVAVAVGAQTYSIDWYSIDGGGGTSSGGNYTLTGTIGQPDAGTLSGGDYTLTGGFMSIVTAIQTPGAPLLKVTREGGNVIVSWPDPSTDFVLQEAGLLATPSSNTVWTDNGGTVTIDEGEKQITIAAPAGNKYFRLRKPAGP